LIVSSLGEIIEFNDAFESTRSVNADPYGAGWMIKIKVSDVADYDRYFQEAYKELIGA
jgi:glycine cleavage system H protein